jgi:DNA-binding NarL/FixJ family response regulator
MTEIVTADKSFLKRAGLKSIVENDSVKITGEITNSSEFWSKINELKPDILILGNNYEDMIGIPDFYKVKLISENTKLIIISDCKENNKILDAIKLGVIGYLTEECDKEEILKAVDSVSKGEKYFCNKILDLIIEKKFEKDSTIKDNLTEREIEIIKLIAEKYTNQEIADKLFISIHTVYTHRKNIMKKLQIKSPVELILYAIDSGIIQSYQN